MTRTEAERVAHAVNALRPDWPTSSLLTLIGQHLKHRAYRDVAVALAWVACDPATRTPGRVVEPGPWWQATQAQSPTVSAVPHKCPDHPEERAWDCAPCAAQATADHQAGVRQLRDTLRQVRS